MSNYKNTFATTTAWEQDDIITADALLERLDRAMGITRTSPIKENHRAIDAYQQGFHDVLRDRRTQNALSTTTGPEGGYLVSDSFDKRLIAALTEDNVMRRICKVDSYGSTTRLPIVTGGGIAAWISEGQPIPESDAKFHQVVLRAHKAATAIRLSDEFVGDALDIEQTLIDLLGERIADLEEEAFVTGDGAGKPYGVLHDAELGCESEKPGAITCDDLIDLRHSLLEPYRRNAVYLMNDATYYEIRKLRDACGQYIFAYNAKTDTRILLGSKVYISKYMPDIASGSTPILYGDFSYYRIADRGTRNIKLLRELYAMNGMIAYILSERVDARLILPAAVKYLKIKES